jgi:Mn2+/Fe2+ NRAMP family transporter
MILTEPFGYWGFILFAASLGIACFGAALEVGLDQAYVVAQTFGWNWGENQHPKEDARFSMTYTTFIFASSLLMVAGIDPLTLTIFSMALTAVILPFVILPFTGSPAGWAGWPKGSGAGGACGMANHFASVGTRCATKA